jgi:hypothetical protein
MIPGVSADGFSDTTWPGCAALLPVVAAEAVVAMPPPIRSVRARLSPASLPNMVVPRKKIGRTNPRRPTAGQILTDRVLRVYRSVHLVL